MLKRILSKYAVYCPECNEELYTVAFGNDVDKLKCKKCDKEYLYISRKRSLQIINKEYSDNYTKFQPILGEYPGIPTSKVYCPRFIQVLLKHYLY